MASLGKHYIASISNLFDPDMKTNLLSRSNRVTLKDRAIPRLDLIFGFLSTPEPGRPSQIFGQKPVEPHGT